MPEGPEVKKMGDLIHVCLGQKLVCIEYIQPTQLQNDSLLLDQILINVETHGKKIFMNFGTHGLLCQPLMAGWWSTKPNPYAKIQFVFDLNSLYYCDTRFGKLQVMSIQQYKKYISTFGPDIMKEMTCDEFKTQIIKKLNWEITKVLLEQKIISGIGNYIKAEALYICGIAPHRRIHTLTEDEIQKLFCCLKIICEESYHDRYQMVVYQKLYDPLGNPVITQTFSDQRTTHWVPLVQK